MKIKATKTFAKYLNTLGLNMTAELVKMSANEYRWRVGDPFMAEQYGDYDYNTGKYAAIMLTYPYSYYACPRFLSTETLRIELSGVRTEPALRSALHDLCEI